MASKVGIGMRFFSMSSTMVTPLSVMSNMRQHDDSTRSASLSTISTFQLDEAALPLTTCAS